MSTYLKKDIIELVRSPRRLMYIPPYVFFGKKSSRKFNKKKKKVEPEGIPLMI